MMQITTSGPQVKGIKRSTFGVRRSKINVTRRRRRVRGVILGLFGGVDYYFF